MTAPESMTYDSLITDVSVYAERETDSVFVAQIPRLVMLAENRIASEARGLGFLRDVTTTLSGATLAKPSRWRETKSVSITVSGETIYLKRRGFQYCKTFNPTGATGVPRFYADEVYEYWYFAPVPGAAYTAEVIYHERPDPLSSSNQTNWTTQYAPQLLLYATLLEAQPFLKTSERLAEFQGLYDRAILAVAKEDEKRQRPDAEAVRD